MWPGLKGKFSPISVLFRQLPTQPSTMASTLPNLHPPSLKSGFLGRAARLHKPSVAFPKHSPLTIQSRPCAKFDLSEILGGRGICNGEKGIEQELKRTVGEPTPLADAEKPEGVEEPSMSSGGRKPTGDEASAAESVPQDAFEKELMGLTGGFPGGEKGLQSFIEKNPPPPKKSAEKASATAVPSLKKPKAPELPLLMPGMIALVKNPNNPYYMYCGIVQRITDGKAGVLFEGGNWDRLITFNLDELERREKGPPMKNPKSVIIENLLQKEP